MEKPIQSLTAPPVFAKYLYWASSYSISICTLYLWGFWSTFDINILQYADVSTIFKLAAVPVVFGSASLVLGALIGHFMFNDEPSEQEREAARNTFFGRVLRNHLRTVLVCWIIGTGLYALFGSSNKWQLLPLLIALPVSSFLSIRGFGADFLPNHAVRRAVIFLGVIAVPYSYAHGLSAADAIESGTQFSYVVSQVEGLDVAPNAEPEIRPRFLGQVTDLLFFFSPVEKTISIVKFNDKKALTLKRFVKPSTSPSEFFAAIWKSVFERSSRVC